MSKKYFITRGGKKEGPYSIEELKNKGITVEYSIWTEGMESWVNVQEFPELKDVIQKAPPPTPYEIKKQQNIEVIKDAFIISLILHILVGVIVFIINGGYFNGDDLVRISRDLPNPVFFADGWGATRFYLIISFLLLPWPISLINGYFSYKAINKNPEYTKKAIKNILISGSILIPLTLFASYKYFIATYPAILAISKSPAEPFAYVPGDAPLAAPASESASASAEEPSPYAPPLPATKAEIAELLKNFVLIRSGEFTMGSPEGEVGRRNIETQHQVRLSSFSISKYAVTVAQFNDFAKVVGGGDWHAGELNHPVVDVTWVGAVSYCKWISAKTGKHFRLPTEAQWEFACRAGSTTPFNTGENLTTNQANYNGNFPYNNNPKGVYRLNTLAVNSFSPNAWGLYNMHGNVWEWCSDWYSDIYYDNCKTKGTVINPAGPTSGSTRVIRGGSHGGYAESCRSAQRSNFRPDGGFDNIGFRLVLVP